MTLHGQVMWFPEQFLISHLSAVAKLMDKKLVQNLSSNRHSFLQTKAQSCQNDLKQCHHQVSKIRKCFLDNFEIEIHEFTGKKFVRFCKYLPLFIVRPFMNKIFFLNLKEVLIKKLY